MALEVRLGDEARLTKDIDVGLRDVVAGSDDLHERLVEVLVVDRDGDGFQLAASRPVVLGSDRLVTRRGASSSQPISAASRSAGSS